MRCCINAMCPLGHDLHRRECNVVFTSYAYWVRKLQFNYTYKELKHSKTKSMRSVGIDYAIQQPIHDIIPPLIS